MTQQAKMRALFLSVIVLLLLCATTTYLSFFYFRDGERWVSHTQEVRGAVGDTEAALSGAARARMTFLMSGNPNDLSEYQDASSRTMEDLKKLQDLTHDNPIQRAKGAQLAANVQERLRVWGETVSAKQQGHSVDLAQLLPQNVELAAKTAAVADDLRAEEDRLLTQRRQVAHKRFMFASYAVVLSFVLALSLLGFYYRLLTRELRVRELAEQSAREAYARELILREEEQRFRLFIEAVKDYAIFTLDAQGHVSSWNEGAARLKGYAASEILGRHFSCFYSPEDSRDGKPARELEAATRNGRVEDDCWRVRKDGSRFWANVTVTAIRDNTGAIIGFAKVTRDFTDRMRAQEALRLANGDLTAEVAERKSAEARLANSERSLRDLSLHLLRTQDEERKRIGRDLHDSLGQYLAVLKMNLDSLESGMGSNLNGASEQVASCVRLADDALKEVRTISYLLYPPLLEEMGLKSAIPWYLDGFSKRSNIQTTFEVDPNFGRITPEGELTLFRILQESLTNVHRHSGSATAAVKLSKRDGEAILEIEDHGKGISPTLLKEFGQDWAGSLGVGLRGMNARVSQLGGKLEVQSTGSGTVVKARIPVGEPLASLTRTA
jgi:PAS domain S-box-containing protein